MSETVMNPGRYWESLSESDRDEYRAEARKYLGKGYKAHFYTEEAIQSAWMSSDPGQAERREIVARLESERAEYQARRLTCSVCGHTDHHIKMFSTGTGVDYCGPCAHSPAEEVAA